ncbi:MAG: hypothetical protein KY476_10255 [Planctomycetes bacterium]|nr:hypothetical protein [Planctomycetota bacterium]
MRLFVAGVAIALFSSVAADGQDRRFPYEAIVEVDEALAHCGPGRTYYATSRLERGTRVRVHRHDPGGWAMIAPPAGSFSLIRADYVRRTEPGRGELTENNVVVRVGSSLDGSHQVEQIRLSAGDTVEILGEVTVDLGSGPTPMYRIRPPRGEFRWIDSRALIPADVAVRQQHDLDPYRIPSNARRESGAATQTGPRATDSGLSNGSGQSADGISADNGPAVRRAGPDPQALAADRGRLEALDATFRAMIQDDISRWDFEALEAEYRELRASAAGPSLAGHIDLRLEAVERYRKRKATWDDVVRLTSETERREAQLSSLQTQHEQNAQKPAGPHAGAAAMASASGSLTFAPRGSTPGANAVDVNNGWMAATSPGRPAPPGALTGPVMLAPSEIVPLPPVADAPGEPQSRQPVTPTPASPRGNRAGFGPFDGAGVIQRSVGPSGGGPRHVLLTPDGRVLAYLQAVPGLDLDRYVGASMGLYGRRYRRPDLRSDVIIVAAMRPVRLAP